MEKYGCLVGTPDSVKNFVLQPLSGEPCFLIIIFDKNLRKNALSCLGANSY